MSAAYYPELQAISTFYGDRRAERSHQPLMEHIISGLALLYDLGASDNAKRAFCLHPLVQNNEPVDVSWSLGFSLACEYRDKANAYLCRNTTDHIKTLDEIEAVVGSMSRDCADMLYVDKFQNRLSFNEYHKGIHARSAEIEHYFDLWIRYINSDRWHK